MASQSIVLPQPVAPVLSPGGWFTTVWYNFFNTLIADGPQIGDCILQAKGPVSDTYLKCDGSAVSRDTYKQLFAVIGTSYGVGDGSTTFNLPNFASPGAPSFWKIHYQ